MFSHLRRCCLTQATRKTAKAKANAPGTDLVKKRKSDKEPNAETWTMSKKQCQMNTWRDYIGDKIEVSKVLDADFHFPKINLMSHWVEQILQYRALQQSSTERHEQAHKMNLTDGGNASNHNLNYLQHVITFQRRIHFIEISKVNLETLAHRWVIIAVTCKVFLSGADLAVPSAPSDMCSPNSWDPQTAAMETILML